MYSSNSYKTKTSACRPEKYEVSRKENDIWISEGLDDENPWCEVSQDGSGGCTDTVSGTFYYNTHHVSVLDKLNPYIYKFKIKVTIRGGNEVWFPKNYIGELDTNYCATKNSECVCDNGN